MTKAVSFHQPSNKTLTLPAGSATMKNIEKDAAVMHPGYKDGKCTKVLDIIEGDIIRLGDLSEADDFVDVPATEIQHCTPLM